ncbi:hypothetical protein T492DRAFT_886959 [Pavlovales sp. CCMP2436]|nr:hypothetical protein T492DRAFT_886959 [Pavlovales sp. CCMP2436]
MRAQFVIEYTRLFPFLLSQQGKWLHVLVRTALSNEQRIFELEEESTVDDEWSSRLTMLKNSVAALRREQEDTRLRNDWKLEQMNTQVTDRVDTIRSELSAKLDSVLEQLGRAAQKGDEPATTMRKRRFQQQTMAMPPNTTQLSPRSSGVLHTARSEHPSARQTRHSRPERQQVDEAPPGARLPPQA